MAKPQLETGAPANAKLLESHAADAEREVVRAKEQLSALRELYQPNGDAETQKSLGAQIDKLQRDLEGAYDLWFKLSKQVREYDRAVDQTRREGEKVPRADVEEFFSQFLLSIKLAIESYIISLSQDATRCESPQEFYQAHDGALRSCMSAAIQQAITDGKLPNWAKVE